jgi:nicotinate-nucleotide adenylyltransferase
MTARHRIGLLGGTLDPIHNGHLEAAEAARRSLTLDVVWILPSRTPPHRLPDPHASGFHRFAMAALAVADRQGMLTSDRELLREGPSYTSHTLEHLTREGFEPSQLFFILGSDAFADISTWYDYPRLLDMSHFVVISRPGMPPPTPDPRLPTPEVKGRVREPHDSGRSSLMGSSSTGIFFIDAQTPQVSSSEIRERVSTGRPIDGLVPKAVAAHIHRHGLYKATDVGPTLNKIARAIE